jgi:hypothetical protein
MAKSFPSTPTAAIIHTKQVVSGTASVAPSDLERAKAHHKWSTTHGPSRKEVVVITSLLTHWPNTAIQAVTKTWNHLGALPPCVTFCQSMEGSGLV